MTQVSYTPDYAAQAAELQRIEERLAKAVSRGDKRRLNQIKTWVINRQAAESRLRVLGYPDEDQ